MSFYPFKWCDARHFLCIRTRPRGAGGEIQLIDDIAGLMAQEKVHAYRYRGARYDFGSKEGYVQATMELALAER